ncbi:MAG: SH3 domain-containing protein [Magnetococcus sp. YQC-5]
MQLSLLTWSLVALPFTLCPGTLLAETLMTNKNGVEVTQTADPTSKLLTTLDKGVSVQVKNKQDRFVQVQLANGTTGWIYQFKLTKDLPKMDAGLTLAALTTSGSIQTKEARSGRSIRGLKKNADDQTRNQHLKALEWMKQFQVSEQELMTFKRIGQIGEFLGTGP